MSKLTPGMIATANAKWAKDHEGMPLIYTSETRDAAGKLLLLPDVYEHPGPAEPGTRQEVAPSLSELRQTP